MRNKGHLLKTLTPGFIAAMSRFNLGADDTLAKLKGDPLLSQQLKDELTEIADDLRANPVIAKRDREIRDGQ